MTTGWARSSVAVPVTSRITSRISRTETPSPRPMFAVRASRRRPLFHVHGFRWARDDAFSGSSPYACRCGPCARPSERPLGAAPTPPALRPRSGWSPSTSCTARTPAGPAAGAPRQNGIPRSPRPSPGTAARTPGSSPRQVSSG
jgi:hypothetical protein